MTGMAIPITAKTMWNASDRPIWQRANHKESIMPHRSFPLEVTGTPAEKLAVVVRHQDRQLVIERRDLVFEVDRGTLVGPEEHFEHVLMPEVHEVLGHRRGELAIGAFHQEIQTCLR